jgi:hypothetical protein
VLLSRAGVPLGYQSCEPTSRLAVAAAAVVLKGSVNPFGLQ